MEKTIVTSAKAPRPVGPYSQAVEAGDFIFLSGQVGMDPATGKLAGDSVAEQAAQVMKNLEGVLSAMGLDLSAVVKTTILLTDINDFAEVNQIYGGYFPADPPARATYAVKALPLGAKVEIEGIAIKNR